MRTGSLRRSYSRRSPRLFWGEGNMIVRSASRVRIRCVGVRSASAMQGRCCFPVSRGGCYRKFSGGRWWRGEEQPDPRAVRSETAKRNAELLTGARKGQSLSELAEFSRSQGKRPSVTSDTGLGTPPLVLTNLLGQETDLRAATKGKITLVTFGFRASGDVMISAYKQAFEKEFGSTKGVQYLEVTVGEDTMWQWSILRNAAVKSLQRSVPLDRHANTLYHVVGDESPLEALQLESRLTGYARLIGPNCRMHWLAQGAPTAEEISEMHQITSNLLGQRKKSVSPSRHNRNA